MTEKGPRIVYMGTPGFAVRPLQVLLEAGHRVVGVITAPDRPAGRGKQLRHSEVKDYVLGREETIPLLQPVSLKDPAFLEDLRNLKSQFSNPVGTLLKILKPLNYSTNR